MFKCLFGNHNYEWNSNIHGDMINQFNGHRTTLRCSKCGKYKTISGYLVPAHKAPQFTSDGYHTFDELYYHRMMLFAVVCNTYSDSAWKSKLHHDDTMYDNYFIVGVETPEGQYTYHYHINQWDMFDVTVLDRAPEWDGHKPEDITRLLSLLK